MIRGTIDALPLRVYEYKTADHWYMYIFPTESKLQEKVMLR